MKNKEEIFKLYIFISVVLYIASTINFITENQTLGVINLCLGSSWLCLASAIKNKKDK